MILNIKRYYFLAFSFLTVLSNMFSGCKKANLTSTDETFIKYYDIGVTSFYENESGNMIMYGEGTFNNQNSNLFLSTMDQYGNLLNVSGFGANYGTVASLYRFDGYYFIYGNTYETPRVRHLDKNLNLLSDHEVKVFENFGTDSEFIVPQKLISASDGGIVILYTLYNGYNFTSGECGLLEVDDSFKNIKWNVSLGSPLSTNDVINTSDGYISCYTNNSNVGEPNNVFLAKTDLNGNILWKNISLDPSNYDLPMNLILMNNDSFIVFYESLAHHNSNFGTLLASTFDQNGTLLSSYDLQTKVSGIGSAVLTADKGFMVTGAHNGVVTIGMLLAKFDAGLHKQWEHDFYSESGGTAGGSLYPLRNGGYVVLASTKAFGKGKTGTGGVIYKTDANGEIH